MVLTEFIKSLPGLGKLAVAVNGRLREAKLRRMFGGGDYRTNFTRIYETNFWGGHDSASGQGSSLSATAAIRENLPILWQRLGVKSILDVPCGDFNWMKEVNLTGITYIGMDIVQAIVENNNNQYSCDNIKFIYGNAISDTIPAADIILCRDLLVHLRTDDILMALNNMRNSGSTYLLATNFPDVSMNEELPVDHWRRINLLRAPFDFPEPINIIDDQPRPCAVRLGKNLSLWKIADLPRLCPGNRQQTTTL